MAKYTRGVGTKLSRSTDGVAYTQIGNVLSVTPAPRRRGALDVADLGSNEDAHASGNLGSGELLATIRFSTAEATLSTLYGDFANADDRHYQVEFADASKQAVEGFITAWTPQAINRDGDVQVQITIQVDGAIPYPA